MPISDEALWAQEEEEFLASRLAPAAPPPPKDYDEQELEWLAEQLSPARPRTPQVDLAKVAEGTSQIPAISEVKEEEFEPLEVTPTTEDMQYAAQQRLQQFDLQKQLTPEDPEKATQIAGIAGEVFAGATPAGIAIDIKDMAKAVETKDPILAAMAGIGAIPFIGDAAKGTFKALRAGDRSAETVRAGRQLLEEVDHAERLWREMHTDSPYFRRWAGEDTPIVNAGDPLPEGPVVIRAYHGTHSARFTEFDPSISREEIGGMHFGTPAQSAEFTRTSGPPAMPLYIRMNNPLRLEDMGSWGNYKVFRAITFEHALNPDWYHMPDDELIAFAETRYKGKRLQLVVDEILGALPGLSVKDQRLAGAMPTGRRAWAEETINELKMQHYVENAVAPSLIPVPTRLEEALGRVDLRHAETLGLSDDEIRILGDLLGGEGGSHVLRQNRLANRALRAKAEAEFVQKTLQHHGHDGIVYENTSEGLGEVFGIDPDTGEALENLQGYKDSYILFDPAKIKSTSNQGTFDPSNPDIMSAAPASLAGALGDSSVA